MKPATTAPIPVPAASDDRPADTCGVDRLTIRLDGLRFHARHGVSEQERLIGQDFTVSLRLDVIPDSRALIADQLDGTVNYAAVYALVRREMEQPSRLVEHVAARIARSLLTDFRAIQSVHITVLKDNPPAGADCHGMGVELTASRRTSAPPHQAEVQTKTLTQNKE